MSDELSFIIAFLVLLNRIFCYNKKNIMKIIEKLFIPTMYWIIINDMILFLTIMMKKYCNERIQYCFVKIVHWRDFNFNETSIFFFLDERQIVNKKINELILIKLCIEIFCRYKWFTILKYLYLSIYCYYILV